MTIKSIGAGILAKRVVKKHKKWAKDPGGIQQKVFRKLISTASSTQFGKDHGFDQIRNHADFVAKVPIRDYEGIRPYVERILEGGSSVLWPGRPLYFAKTSGTTSGAKYIPLTKDSMPAHIDAARDAMLCYVAQTGRKEFVDGKMIFLQGSPELEEKEGIQYGRLSGIVAHYVPKYLQQNRLPSWETNCIEDWEEKVEAIVTETIDQPMTLIGGIPSWVQMYFERLYARSGKLVGELFKDLELFIYGGVNFEPYRKKFEDLMGRPINSIELYPASEGFFAFQNDQDDPGLLLQINSGMFYEFVPADRFFDEDPPRLTIEQVELGVNYVLLVSSNAGLWAYNVGDTIRFTSLAPPKVVVTGRIKHFISAFGEHVIGKEVETAMETALSQLDFSVTEFTVAPQVTPVEGELPYHQWLIEFEQAPSDMPALAAILEDSLRQQNSYYDDLIAGKILQPLKIVILEKGAFNRYMAQKGKLGGQNKIPRLTNDRELADALLAP